MNTENSTTNEFIYQFTDKINLENPNSKNIGLFNLIIYCTWKDIKSAYNNNKFKISASTWNDEFDFPDGSNSISEIQDYFEFIIEKRETLAESCLIKIYPNKIKNRIVLKIKTGYKIELLSPETMKLLGSTKKNVNKDKFHDQSGNAEVRYKPSKQIRFKTSMLRSDLCDFSDAYIVVKGTMTVTNPDNNAYDKKLAFKINAPFVSCILKINITLADNAEDLVVVMPMYNLLEYSKNYSKITGSFWNYY